jgi:hypothetical protein
MKWAYLEKRSTTVRITDLPATSSGCRRPADWRVSVLLRWHVVQV